MLVLLYIVVCVYMYIANLQLAGICTTMKSRQFIRMLLWDLKVCRICEYTYIYA